MRRIIERTVTVVTTTTWTISWQDDAIRADPEAGRADQAGLQPKVLPDTAQHARQFSSVIETKEADPPQTKTETDPTADRPPL
jgi:hypothetical protein